MSKQKYILLKHKSQPDDSYHRHFLSNDPSSLLHFIPVINHVPVNVRRLREYLEDEETFSRISALIITSQRAVETLLCTIGEIANKREGNSFAEKAFKKPVFAVGPATSSLLSENGFLDVRGGIDAGHGTDLAEIIVNDQAALEARSDYSTEQREEKAELRKKDKFLLFLTGKIRRDIIPNQLKSHSINFIEQIVYETVPEGSALETFKLTIGHHLNENENVNKNMNATGLNFEQHKGSISKGVSNGHALASNSGVDLHSAERQHWVVFFSPQGTEEIVNYILQHAIPLDTREEKPHDIVFKGSAVRFKVASIGPTTADYLCNKGVFPHVVAKKPSPVSLQESILEFERGTSQ